jgi:hypothetical protein
MLIRDLLYCFVYYCLLFLALQKLSNKEILQSL